jgi:glyoxylase-like metal-dependent hydrolase (beta-lactamase superfamily II)
MFREAVEKKTSLDGSAMSDDERAAYESTIAIAQEYLDEMPDFHMTLPTKTFEDRLVLTRGERTIEIRRVGPGVTPGDAVVYLPKEGVLVAGDIVDNPLPFAYRCNVSGWIAALDSVRALKPRVIVPGHGAVMRDDSRVQQLGQLLASIREQTVAAKAKGETLEAAFGGINVSTFRGPIVGENKMLAFLFDGFFVGQVARSAYDEAPAK